MRHRLTLTLFAGLLAGVPAAVIAEDTPAKEQPPAAAPAEVKPWPEAQPIRKAVVGKTPALTSFGPYVYFAGQPGPEDLKALKEKGVKHVINLRAPEEMKFDEKAEIEKLGLTYLQVPVAPSGPPSPEEFEKIATTLDKAGKGEPVLLHCASSNRVGLVWGLYRARRHGLSLDDALAEGKAAGLKAPPLADLLKRELTAPAPPAAEGDAQKKD